ncbi:Major facilitator superfamily domain general substrate transporter, partial [Penicillium expansum]
DLFTYLSQKEDVLGHDHEETLESAHWLGFCIPVAAVMLFMQRQAESSGTLEKTRSGRVWWQSIAHYLIEFDGIGIILITAASSLILIPFSIASYGPNGWATGYIIAMEVLGVACVPAFYIWERYCSPVQFLPWKYLKEPTMIGSCMLYGVMFISCFTWNNYFSSYLQVVNRLDITTAKYVLNAFSLTSFVFSPIFSLVMSWTGDFKWTAMAGVPIFLLGTALLVPFRAPDTHVEILTMIQILVGLGSCLFTESKHLSVSIFSDLVMQMSYADGTGERDAIVRAHADVQRKMAIVG